MHNFVLTLMFATGTAFVMQLSSSGTDDKKAEDKGPAALEGGYAIVSGEHGGKAIPEAEIKGSVVQITGNKIVGTDKDKKEFFSCTYTLDTSKTPWVINMKNNDPKGESAPGLIKKDGDTVKIIYALPGGTAPKEFKTKEKQHLFVLKAVKDPPNKFSKE